MCFRACRLKVKWWAQSLVGNATRQSVRTRRKQVLVKVMTCRDSGEAKVAFWSPYSYSLNSLSVRVLYNSLNSLSVRVLYNVLERGIGLPAPDFK